ncbi:MAG TPA: HupE/UreJ family protein [Steroidobacteraceae bacterium]|nr:HupE/UreJ family protein [Steroidobacteraceae bacterium]
MKASAAIRHLCVLAILGFAAPLAAHDARPLSINITEQAATLYTARVRVPPTLPIENRVTVLWPAGCRVINDDTRGLDTDGAENEAVQCRGGLEGRTIKVTYRVYNPALPTLFRLSRIDGQVITQLLPPDVLAWTVPRTPSTWDVAAGYLKLGVRHIWTGIDHLLFVTGLLILARTRRRVVLAITGFTLAHSITLSLSALNLVVLPEPPVEAAIALSILFLAYEIARPHPEGLAGRYPILVASSFGLLHGFGFAAALREAGLPTRELAVGLFCFNCGVEIGQILFIGALLSVACLLRWALMVSGMNNLATVLQQHARVIGGYGLGVPAAFWFIQRLAAF